MADPGLSIQRLVDAEPLREPVLRSAIDTLGLAPGSRGLDVGCGIGLQARLLAEAVGPDGHVTGLDIAPELLAHGQRLLEGSGLSTRITFRTGDMRDLPFADATFDWVWSADCVGYPVGEPPTALGESVRVTKPGGSVVILGWSSQQVLPGYPLLEARLNASCSGYLPFLSGRGPERHFLRALGWFRDLGLVDVRAQTFVGDVQAPLSTGVRAGLQSLLEMLWTEPASGGSAGDWSEYRRLSTPGSPHHLLDEPDYYAFFTCSMFRGTAPGA